MLKPTGSIYLHCDPTMSHYLKLLMDAVFGKKQFRNEIVWCYAKPRPAKHQFVRNHDTILFYGKSSKTKFNPQRVPNSKGEFKLRKPFKRPDGSVWNPKEPGIMAGSWWIDIPSFATTMNSDEKCGYPTQKPLALLQRIIKASSNEGDVVLDPFCGCATTCVAAEQLGRKWVGIDFSSKAVELVKMRIDKVIGPLIYKGVSRTDIPKRTDLGSYSKSVPKDAKRVLYGEQSGICNGCGTHFEAQHLEVDHIIAKKSGGSNIIDNLQLLCGSCNRIKGKRGMEYLVNRLQETAVDRFKWGLRGR